MKQKNEFSKQEKTEILEAWQHAPQKELGEIVEGYIAWQFGTSREVINEILTEANTAAKKPKAGKTQ